jgi:hypothetical protein
MRLAVLGTVLLAGLAVGCGDGSDPGVPRIDQLVPARGVPGDCVHIVGVRFGSGGGADGSIFLDAGRRDSGSPIILPIDGGVRDGGVGDGGVRDAGPLVIDAGPQRDASVELCLDGDPPPSGGSVSFGGRAARVRRWDEGRIVVEVPAGSGATLVVVTVDGRASNAVDFQIE